MIFLMVYCFSFIFLFKFFSLKNGAFMLTSLAWFWTQLSHSFLLSLSKNLCFTSFNLSAIMPLKKEAADVRAENVQYEQKISLLDLPELALESILERLPPPTLSNMTGVCSFLRERCISDYLWERQMKQKWGRLIGDAAHREWQCHIAFENRSTHLKGNKQIAFFGYASSLWPIMWGKSVLGIDNKFSSLPEDSIMAWYLALETGKFWFPAQVYNRENGSIGFMLSCYDAEVSYDSASDSFKARYSPQGRRTVEYNVGWDRIRPPAVDTPAHSLHASDCLHDLRPGDHIEIQWRRNKEFPYGWWYAVVGHLESCDGNSTHCQCHSSDTVILEFKQYTPGSRWRRTAINRKEHRELGNEADGFYGGIRKLYCEDEISVWKSLWPAQVLE